MVRRAAVACNVAVTRGGGGRRRATAAAAAACGGVWLLSPQLPGGANDESYYNQYRRRGRQTRSGGTMSAQSVCVRT